ncbi:MAG: hypothetical protein ABIO24_04825 [Saprospiraceae bacterium]
MNRSLAVDFYRGVTIAFMIIVNTPGSWAYAYAPLRHATWEGCTLSDLVFPSFMYIMGVSMWFSFGKYDRQWSAVLGWKILQRTALLFLLGLLLNQFPIYWRDWDHWRIYGILQRLALCYGLTSVLVLTLSRKVLIWVSAAILLAYWAILYNSGLPGMHPYSPAGNAVLRLDRWLIGSSHLWHGEGVLFDPEGLLSTLPAIVTVVLGWLSGELIAYRSRQKDLLVRDLLVFGLLCGFMGLAWDLFLPINKKLWTSSYVLYAGGISMVLLAASIWLIELRGWRNGTGFFLAFGANSLFAYVLSEALITIFQNIQWGEDMNLQKWFYSTLYEPIEGAEFSSLLFALTYLLICWLVCRWLYVRQIFFKL